MPTLLERPETLRPAVQTTCYHCGGEVLHPIVFQEKIFCCEGCQTVYDILQANNMGQYYDLGERPGRRMDKAQDAERYAYLDHPDIQASLFDFAEGNLARINLFLPSIHCSSCIWLLENLHRLHPGVQQVLVNFGKKQADITFDKEQLPLRKLAELLAAIGYEPNFNLSQADKQQTANPQRSLAYKIGVAGFVFGNSMLLSFPDYLAMDKSLLEGYQEVFNAINFTLSLPIVFYCSADYFKGAYYNLKHRTLGIDVPLALGIVAIFAWSTYEILSGLGTGYFDSLAGLLFFLLTGRWYQQKTYQTLSFERDYKAYFPIAATVINAEQEAEARPLQEVKVGDRLRIRHKELIPADSILLSETADIDYSFVTGEALPVQKHKGERLYAGGRQMGSSIEVQVSKEVAQSYLTKLWNQQQYNKDYQPVLSSILHRAGTYFTVLVLVVSALTLAYWLWAQPRMALMATTSVLIVACPCALALSLPYAFGNVLRLYGRRGLYLKNTDVIEKMTEVDTLVFDKTGTLSHAQAGLVQWEGEALSEAELAAVKTLCEHSTHPLSRSIHASLVGLAAHGQLEDFQERVGQGIVARIGGVEWRLGSAAWLGAEQPAGGDDPMQTQVYLAKEGRVLGHFNLQKNYREGLEALFADLSKRYDLYLLSGDGDAERERLLPLFGSAERMRFKQSPTDKLAFVEALQAQGRKVLMVGDGLNDAGALQQSWVGLAIAEDIHSFTPASDAILDAQQFAHLGQLLAFSHRARRILRTSFLLSLSYNAVGLSVAVQGLLTPLLAAILMPLSSVTVVGFVVLAGSLAGRLYLPAETNAKTDLDHL